MKKLITIFLLVLGFAFGTAQKSSKMSATRTEAKQKKAHHKQSGNQAIKLKKDGTPDKRYKANQKLKKDGTPDKRYKVNKK